jgi:cardiolipin synthase A/B
MWTLSADFWTAYHILEWIVRLGALAIVPQRRSPAAARSWLLLIFFLPIAGLLLLLAIGSPHFPKWRAERFVHLLPFFRDVSARLEAAGSLQFRELEPAALLAGRLGHLPAVSGNSVELIDDYDAVIERLVVDIDGARRYVRILVYIFADDATGRKVISALGRAVARGVICQVMIDAVGSQHWIRDTIRLLRAVGVEAREALPFRLLRGRTRRDMRNHRKLFVIDGEIGFAGSQNIVDKDFKPKIVNREMVARVTGPVVAEMEAVVRADWYLETGSMSDAQLNIPLWTGDASAQLLPSGADYPLEGFETMLVWQLHQARERVIIATPYFIPDEDILSAMRIAVARGVEIDLVLSAVADQWLVSLAQSSYYDDLLSAGIRIHLFRNYLLHAKNVSIDGRFAIIGSSNVDLRSFTLNEEVSLLLFDAVSVRRTEEIQRRYLEGSDLLQQDRWRARPALRKLGENVARLVDSLL